MALLIRINHMLDVFVSVLKIVRKINESVQIFYLDVNSFKNEFVPSVVLLMTVNAVIMETIHTFLNQFCDRRNLIYF